MTETFEKNEKGEFLFEMPDLYFTTSFPPFLQVRAEVGENKLRYIVSKEQTRNIRRYHSRVFELFILAHIFVNDSNRQLQDLLAKKIKLKNLLLI